MADFEEECDELCNTLFQKKVENGEITYDELNETIKQKIFNEAQDNWASDHADEGDMAYDRWKDDQAELAHEESLETERTIGIKNGEQ